MLKYHLQTCEKQNMVKAIDLGIANLQQKFFQSIQQENVFKYILMIGGFKLR